MVGHRIRRQVVELHAPERALAKQLQDRMSRLQRERLVPLFDRLCGELSPPGRIERIERIDLDLGEVPARGFERIVLERLEPALSEALSRQLARQRAAARQRGEPTVAVSGALETLEVFARTGGLPWWVDARELRLLPRAVGRLVREAPEATAALMRTLAERPSALERLAIALDDESLARLCGVAEPPARGPRATLAAGRPGDLARHVVALVEGSATSLGLTLTRLRRAAWQGALREAASPTGTTARERVKQVLTLAALHVGTTYRAVLGGIVEALRGEGATARASSDPALGGRVSLVESLVESLVAERSEVERRAMLVRSAPLERARTSRGRRGHDVADPEPGASRSVEPPSRGQTAARPRPSRRERTPTPSRTPSGDVLVDDAGLVLLAPFLRRFFETLGLVDDEHRFHDTAAQHRAVGLLHHLATADPAPLEYHLPLAKALCGLGLDDVVDVGPPASEAEGEAGEALLYAVIDRAPIFNGMSTAGFRATFLRRAGLVGPRDGAWLLRVERETYDIVLDQLPWTFEWVRLPWMETLMHVEWS